MSSTRGFAIGFGRTWPKSSDGWGSRPCGGFPGVWLLVQSADQAALTSHGDDACGESDPDREDEIHHQLDHGVDRIDRVLLKMGHHGDQKVGGKAHPCDEAERELAHRANREVDPVVDAVRVIHRGHPRVAVWGF